MRTRGGFGQALLRSLVSGTDQHRYLVSITLFVYLFIYLRILFIY